MTGPSFDQDRSDAIRAMLVDTVDTSPAREHRRRARLILLAVLAALGIGLGSSAVAVAVGGIDLFGPPAATQAAVDPAASATPTATPTPSATPTREPHPLVVTGDPISPRDVLAAPPATPAWTIEVPGAGDPCQPVSVLDVSDGFALVKSGPTRLPEDLGTNGCAPAETRLWLSLVDTRDGTIVWTRDWTWPFAQETMPQSDVSLLGTSGTVLVRTILLGVPPTEPYPFEVPNEVLDLATGSTLGEVAFANQYDARPRVEPVADDSGDVLVSRQTDAGTSEVLRAHPLDLSAPVWSIQLPSAHAGFAAAPSDSSVLPITYVDGGKSMIEVVDVETGAVMHQGPTDRQYDFRDGVTLRLRSGDNKQVSVAGIDAAGNEFWSRDDPAGIMVGHVSETRANPLAKFQSSSVVPIMHADGRLELVDGLTGETGWIADGSGCDRGLADFQLTPDGFLIQWVSSPNELYVQEPRVAACAFTPEGELTDAGSHADLRPDYTSPSGSAAAYDLEGGWGTGGLATYKYRSPEGTVPTGTVRDAITGQVLWTRPIASDEYWTFAGGYLVGLSGGTMFGLG
ncbi:hypothetical protein ACFJGV_08525 [Cnuibacter sp. UC19_7]|uniref:hypothetical protein n=1 Tax=Cnuibacter sp. UC19_7 TaxID=3350166 RepID=UPI00366C8DB0